MSTLQVHHCVALQVFYSRELAPGGVDNMIKTIKQMEYVYSLLMLYDSRAKVLQYVTFTCVPNSCLSTHASCHTIDKMDQESFSPPPKVLFCPLQQTLNFYYALIVSGVSIMSVVI